MDEDIVRRLVMCFSSDVCGNVGNFRLYRFLPAGHAVSLSSLVRMHKGNDDDYMRKVCFYS